MDNNNVHTPSNTLKIAKFIGTIIVVAAVLVIHIDTNVVTIDIAVNNLKPETNSRNYLAPIIFNNLTLMAFHGRCYLFFSMVGGFTTESWDSFAHSSGHNAKVRPFVSLFPCKGIPLVGSR